MQGTSSVGQIVQKVERISEIYPKIINIYDRQIKSLFCLKIRQKKRAMDVCPH